MKFADNIPLIEKEIASLTQKPFFLPGDALVRILSASDSLDATRACRAYSSGHGWPEMTDACRLECVLRLSCAKWNHAIHANESIADPEDRWPACANEYTIDYWRDEGRANFFQSEFLDIPTSL